MLAILKPVAVYHHPRALCWGKQHSGIIVTRAPYPNKRVRCFVFNLDDSLESRASGGFIQKAATIVAVSISGLASFQFFATYSGGLLAGIVPAQFLSIAAGLIGVVMCEAACLYWQWSVQHDADSKSQLQIAQAGYWLSLTISVVITVLYFALTSSLVAPYLQDVQHIIDAFAAVTLVAAIGAQFTLKISYGAAATQAAKALQDAQIRALQGEAAYVVRQQSTKADLQNSLAELQRVLPDVSRARGAQTAGEFISQRYGVNGANPTKAGRG